MDVSALAVADGAAAAPVLPPAQQRLRGSLVSSIRSAVAAGSLAFDASALSSAAHVTAAGDGAPSYEDAGDAYASLEHAAPENASDAACCVAYRHPLFALRFLERLVVLRSLVASGSLLRPLSRGLGRYARVSVSAVEAWLHVHDAPLLHEAHRILCALLDALAARSEAQ